MRPPFGYKALKNVQSKDKKQFYKNSLFYKYQG